MAVVNPPFVIQDLTHASDTFRRMVKALRIQQGVATPADLVVAQHSTPAMSVDIATGIALIDGTQDPVHQGSYVCLNDATTTLTIAASDPTNPRIDLVVAKVQDSQYSGATDAWSLAVVTGTPAPSPSVPAAPANSLPLAQVAVAALAASIVNANITDLRATRFTKGSTQAVPSNFVTTASWQSVGPILTVVLPQASDILVLTTACFRNSGAAGADVNSRVILDGTTTGFEVDQMNPSTNYDMGCDISDRFVAVAAGSHTFQLQLQTPSGSTTTAFKGSGVQIIAIAVP